MASKEALAASTFQSDLGFNWVFLVELLICGALSLFFLFYFNRLFAALISYGLRTWTWHWYRVHVNIEALQLSLLGGRIFFRGVRYVGNNECVMIHSGTITWCYWLRKCKEIGLRDQHERPVQPQIPNPTDGEKQRQQNHTVDGGEEGSISKPSNLPCRLHITLNGVEWFIYNRSAAYDAILAGIIQVPGQAGLTPEEFQENESSGHESGIPKGVSDMDSGPNHTHLAYSGTPSNPITSSEKEPPVTILHQTISPAPEAASGDNMEQPSSGEDAFILRFLPIHLECTKAAAVLGNEHTRSVVVTKADRISGEIDATKSPTIDQYRQLIDLKFEHPIVQMKPNEAFKGDVSCPVMSNRPHQSHHVESKDQRIRSHSQSRRRPQKAWYSWRNLLYTSRSSVESFFQAGNEPQDAGIQGSNYASWQGLSRYLDDIEHDQKPTWAAVEYAALPTIADSPEARVKYYWDIPKKIPSSASGVSTSDGEASDADGQAPPEWGVDISLKGALVNYGPWADRQRAEIQRVFFPSLCRDAVPSQDLVKGQSRVPTQFKIYVELDEETTLRIPVREESKNWKWANRTETMGKGPIGAGGPQGRNRKRKSKHEARGSQTRPFGWVDVKVASNATLRYTMDMLAGPCGFSNLVNLRLPYAEITTSVNHGLLWKSSNNRIICDLSNPLQWNGLRTWKFEVHSNGLELFILREHIVLLSDLLDDWASGPPPDYLIFSPFKYELDLRMADFRIYLNVNDSNIINNPSDFDDNTFIVIFGETLEAELALPSQILRPHRNTISFNVRAEHGGLNLRVPPWNTQATFLSSTELALSTALKIAGKYQYCATTSSTSTDTLLLDVHCHALSVHLYGFIIRYLLNAKDNYLGDDIRFRTLEEYQEVLRMSHTERADSRNIIPHKQSNDLDVILSISTDDSIVILPSNLYTSKKFVCLDIAHISADLRFTNYYMELDVRLDALALSNEDVENDGAGPKCATSGTQLFINGMDIAGNRLFGLPPTEPTYVCNWDFTVGAINGQCTTDFLSRLVSSLRAFAFSFDDDENALPSVIESALHDITFLRISLDSIMIWLHLEDTAFMLSTGPVSAAFNDFSSTNYSKKVRLRVPDLSLSCVDAESTSRHRSRPQHPADTHALVQTTLWVTMIHRQPSLESGRRLQQEHIRRHDRRTNRVPFLLFHEQAADGVESSVKLPAISVPPMPRPRYQWGQESERTQPILTDDFLEDVFVGYQNLPSSICDSGVERFAAIKGAFASSGPKEDPLSKSLKQSLKVSSTNHLSIRGRDNSTSTGRQPSFYNAFDDKVGVLPSVAFSSQYSAPYFPLEGLRPNTQNLPPPPMERVESAASKLSLTDVHVNQVPWDAAHSSFIVELPRGLTGVLNPATVRAVAELLSSIQPTTPNDLLDVLQIDAINKVSSRENIKRRYGKIIDCRVRTPGVNLRFLNTPPSTDSSEENKRKRVHDQYDISMTGVDTVLRSQSLEGSEDTINTPVISLLHLSIYSANFTVGERHDDVCDFRAAVNLAIDEFVLWRTRDDVTSIGLVFNCLDITMASNKLLYLYSLLHRTKALANEFDIAFSRPVKEQQDRARLLAYLLATTEPQQADPPFFTRPSYVLRAAENHIRTSDSWKIITRLRHTYNSIPSHGRQEISARCSSNLEEAPSNARQRFLACFDEWRGWDFSNTDSCLLVKTLYGAKSGSPPTPDDILQALNFSLKTQLLRFVLDRGPKQNEVSIHRVTTTYQRHVPNSDRQSIHQSQGLDTLLRILCGDFTVILNWELCELAEVILSLSQKSQVARTPPPKSHRPGRMEQWHVLLNTQTASITIDTINIRSVLASEGFNVSCIAKSDEEKSFHVTCAAEAASATTQSHGRELILIEISYPSVCCSYETQVVDGISVDLIKCAANCDQLSLLVRQDILVLTEVFDVFLRDEIGQIHQLVRIASARRSHISKSQNNTLTNNLTHNFNIALFLGTYFISMPILQSLTYSISGLVARASVATQNGPDLILDFDIKENSHNLQTHMMGGNRSVSCWQMPPINGRILSQVNERETKIGVFASLEPISLDASALHNLLSALGRPEISSMFSVVQEDIESIKRRTAALFGQRHKPLQEPTQPGKPIIYDAHLTVAGLDVFANAKGSPGFDTARLRFSLGCIQLVSTNRLDQTGPVLAFPEIQFSLRRATFDLSRENSSVVQACGRLAFEAVVNVTTKLNDAGREVPLLHVKSESLEIKLFAETASSVVDVMAHLQDKIKDLDLSRESNYLHRLRKSRPRIANDSGIPGSIAVGLPMMSNAMYSLELLNVQISWVVATFDGASSSELAEENLVLSSKRLNLSTRKSNFARLTIEDLQLQMAPTTHLASQRSPNSALLPEIIFNVGYVTTADARRLAFQAAGKSLDLRLTSDCIIPAAKLQKSLSSAVDQVRAISGRVTTGAMGTSPDNSRPPRFFGQKRMESLLVDADFAGAVVYLSGATSSRTSSKWSDEDVSKLPQTGNQGQFPPHSANHSIILRAPGLAWKIEYRDSGVAEPSLVAEVKVDASSNILYPAVVPLILEISSTIKEIVSQGDQERKPANTIPPQKGFIGLEEDNFLMADPSAVLGRMRLNLGLRICRQEFSLSCQPISRVAATARFDDIYMIVNNVRSSEHGHFFAVSAAFTRLQTSIQHVYSRESTGSFDVDSIFLSLMNSKHVNGISGISAILRISPMVILVNGKQLQDFLLFREIWMPSESRAPSTSPVQPTTLQSQTFLVRRYQQVASTGAFPWNATVSIAGLDIRVDLGQAIGKSTFMISNFWMSSKKNSDWEQNLCLGFDDVSIESTGRMSGLVTLQQFSIRTSIQWPGRETAQSQTPLVQGSSGFSQLRVKAAFDHQAFLVADISSFEFLMYNVRNGANDRLVAILNGEAGHGFCTTATASQALALYQAFERLVQEKRTNFETSLKEIEKFLNRNPVSHTKQLPLVSSAKVIRDFKVLKPPLSLHTDVIVTLKTINVGAFPITFSDHQVFKFEALDAQARFAVAMDKGKIHSILGLNLGQLRIGLAGVKKLDLPRTVGELSVEDIVKNATGSRGGTILKVPKVKATMETWQAAGSNHIDYIFRSSFEGKVEIGWNYSRIAYIRNMWATHTKALAQRLGKPLPPSAVRITGVPDDESGQTAEREQAKITAEVNVPQSKYEYTALEPPIIETPQLREMGEATPPLEWIGLHRDRLPNLTHQILIVTLQELASEVEDAYAKILGSS